MQMPCLCVCVRQDPGVMKQNKLYQAADVLNGVYVVLVVVDKIVSLFTPPQGGKKGGPKA